MLRIHLNTIPIESNIIQVYAPTADKTDEIIEAFYNNLTNTLRRLPKNNLIISDFNANVSHSQFKILEEHNEHGELLIDFEMEEQFIVTNMPFSNVLPEDLEITSDHIVRNQIDYIMGIKRFLKTYLSAKTHPGTHIKSDHNLLLGTITLKLKMFQMFIILENFLKAG